jgi:hypothetical protein
MEERLKKLEQMVAKHDEFIRGANRGAITPLTADLLFQSRFKQILVGKKTIDFGNIVAQGNADDTIFVNGARNGDIVLIGLPSTATTHDAISYKGLVSANDTVKIVAHNDDDSNAYNPDSGEFTVAVLKL